MFEVVGKVADIEAIATGRGIRRLKHLRKRYGGRRWRKLKGKATVRLNNGALRRAEIHWYEAHGVGKKGLKIKRFSGLTIMALPQSSGSFALCVEDGGSEDLEPRKIYQVLADREAAREGYIRIVDESGEDYIYPSELFVAIRLPAAVLRRLSGTARARQRSARPRSAKSRVRRAREGQ